MFKKIIEKIRLLFVAEDILLSSDKQEDVIKSKAQKVLLGLFVLTFISLVIWLIYAFYFVTSQQDILTSKSFIFEGKRAYITYFLENHPFMLYIFLPVVGIFNGSGQIGNAMRICSLLLILASSGISFFAAWLFIKKEYVYLRSFIYKVEFCILTIIALVILFWFTYTFVLLGDEREHLTSSYLIYNGQRPYIDFFEHHHPLLWYVFLPVLHFFQNSGEVWYAIRTFSLVLIFINTFVVFKVSYLIVPNKTFSWLAALFSICSHVVFVAQISFRPDTLMSLLLFSGLYFFLKYLKERHDWLMYTAFVFFFFSFMALQKALLFLFFVALLMLYLIVKKELSLGLIFKALIVPAILFLGYLFYLYQTQALKDYFELNYLLNIKANYRFTYDIKETIWFWLGNTLAVVMLVTNRSKFLKYLSFLCICFSVILIMLGTFVQYWIPLYSLLAIISAYTVFRLKDSLRLIVMAVIVISTASNNLPYIEDQKNFYHLDFFVNITNMVQRTVSKDDEIVGNLAFLGGLNKDATGYYWFGRDYMAVIDNHYFNRHPLPDINDIIRKKKPKIISYEQQPGCTNEDYSNDRNCNKRYKYDFRFLRKYYVQRGPLLIRYDISN